MENKLIGIEADSAIEALIKAGFEVEDGQTYYGFKTADGRDLRTACLDLETAQRVATKRNWVVVEKVYCK